MSAIFGAIDFNRNSLPTGMDEIMRKPYDSYAIDRYHSLFKSHILTGCALQYITNESVNECLPTYNKERGLYFTADCYLDNRSELLSLLSLPSDTPDGSILYESYLKWDTKCVDYVIGNFAFAVYDEIKNIAYLFVDHVASRCLYYFFDHDVLYFSTLAKPILAACNHTIPFDDRFILDCISSYSPVIYTDPEETAYVGVHKIKAGNYVSFQANTLQKHCYWNPVKSIKVRKRASDELYQKEFLQVFSEAVTSSLRSCGEVGIFLSSGLDSSSIACLAAPKLQEEGKNLYSFTSIPEPGYVNDLEKGLIADESEGVMKICEQYPNIIPSFESCTNKTLFSEASQIISILELPTKSQNNAVWSNEAAKKATQMNCKVLLDGQTGNTTISAGSYIEYIQYLFRHLKFIRAYKEIKLYSKVNHFNPKKVLKVQLGINCTSFIEHFISDNQSFHKNLCVNECMSQKYDTKKRFHKKHRNSPSSHILTFHERRSFMFFPSCYSQVGEIKTKLGLKYGMLLKDPLCNKKLIEFCLTLPLSCFVSEQYDRRLIRKYMKEIVPDSILNDIYHRGCQSADNQYRFQKHWLEYKEEFYQVLHAPFIIKYLDCKKLDALSQQLENDLNANDGTTFLHLMNIYTMCTFIRLISI